MLHRSVINLLSKIRYRAADNPRNIAIHPLALQCAVSGCRFDKLDLNKNGFLEREDLLSLPELSVNPLGDRIIHAFFSENQTVRDTQKLQFQAGQIQSYATHNK